MAPKQALSLYNYKDCVLLLLYIIIENLCHERCVWLSECMFTDRDNLSGVLTGPV